MKRRVLAVVGVVVVVGMSAGVALADAPPAGQQFFESKCASCHGKDGAGQTAMGKKLGLRDLRSAEVQKQSDQQLFDITAKGKNKMPAFEKKLTEQQIRELVTYIRQLAK